MLVELKNIGRGARAMYDTRGRMVTIPVGGIRRVDLADRIVHRLRLAQEKGDTLEVLTAQQELPEPTPPAIDLDHPTAEMILANADALDYQQMLAAVRKLAPDSHLPQRPTKARMLEVLRGLAA